MILENNYLKVEINQKGAEVIGMYDKNKSKSLMWNGEMPWWGRVSPVLFPIVGGLNNNTLIHEGKKYTLPSHGFLRDTDMELESQTKDTVWYSFSSNETTKKNYPFDFKIRIGYELKDNKLRVLWNVINTGESDLLFSIGAHPAFLSDEGDTLSIETRATPSRYIIGQDGMEAGYKETVETIEVRPEVFYGDALIYDNVDAITLHTQDSNIKLSFKDFEYVGIWSKIIDDKMAPFVCIEPWMGISYFKDFSGEFKDKTGIQTLSSDNEITYTYEIEIS